MPPDNMCSDCDGAGYYKLAVPVGHPNFGKLFACACLIRARERRDLERAVQQAQTLLAELRSTLGRLAHARFDSFDLNRPLVELAWGGVRFPVDLQRQALAQARDDGQCYAEKPTGWLYLCGPCGAGKSHLAAAIANYLAMRGQGVTYASVPDLLRFIRRGFGDGAAAERLDALMQIDVLILDDLGAENLTAWASEQLFVLLNARYLATSNDRPQALPARIHSRIAEQAQVIWMPVSDYRQLRAGDEYGCFRTPSSEMMWWCEPSTPPSRRLARPLAALSPHCDAIAYGTRSQIVNPQRSSSRPSRAVAFRSMRPRWRDGRSAARQGSSCDSASRMAL